MHFIKAFLFILTITAPIVADDNLTQNVPETWRKETFTFPLSFAPQIKYKGIEEVYFAPGMFDPKSDEYFNYVFLWHLEGHQTISAAEYTDFMRFYYEGLYKVVTKRQTSPKFTFKTVKKNQNSGPLKLVGHWLDVFNGENSVDLELLIFEKHCPTADKTNILFKITEKGHKGANDILQQIDHPNCS